MVSKIRNRNPLYNLDIKLQRQNIGDVVFSQLRNCSQIKTKIYNEGETFLSFVQVLNASVTRLRITNVKLINKIKNKQIRQV